MKAWNKALSRTYLYVSRVSCTTDRETDRQTDRLTDSRTDWQTHTLRIDSSKKKNRYARLRITF